MNIKARNVALFLLLVLSGVVIAENKSDPGFWLKRMSNASHSLNYEGVFVYLNHGQMQTLKVTQGVDALC